MNNLYFLIILFLLIHISFGYISYTRIKIDGARKGIYKNSKRFINLDDITRHPIGNNTYKLKSSKNSVQEALIFVTWKDNIESSNITTLFSEGRTDFIKPTLYEGIQREKRQIENDIEKNVNFNKRVDNVCGNCGGPIYEGSRWKTSQPIAVNGDNDIGINDSQFINSVIEAFETWESFMDFKFRDGLLPPSVVDGEDLLNPDGKNEILFGHISNPGALAVTYVWLDTSSSIPIEQREIYEFDIVVSLDFNWGDATINSNRWDLLNTITHEVGHALGLKDIPDPSCSFVTMYAYSSKGEIKKRTLEPDDICHINSLYGEVYLGPIPRGVSNKGDRISYNCVYSIFLICWLLLILRK